MFRLLQLLLVLGIFLTGTLQAADAPSPLAHFSREVDLLLRLKEPDRTLEKIVALVNKVQPGAGEALKEQQTALLGQLVSNPGLTGVDLSRDWYAGVYFHEGTAPVVVFAIPAVNTDDLVGAIGEMTAKVHGNWVVYTDAEELPAVEESTSATKLLNPANLAYFTGGDLNIYANVDHVTTVYAEQIELAQDKILETLNQLRFLPAQGSFNPQVVIETYGTLAEGLFQALEDGQISLASISLTENDLLMNKQVTFADDSVSAAFLAKNPPNALENLLHLPSGAQFYYGMSGDMNELTRVGMKLGAEMASDKKAAEKITENLSLVDSIKFGPLVASLAISHKDKDVFRATSVVEGEPIDALRDLNRKTAEASGSIENDVMKQSSVLKLDAETYGTRKADVVELTQEIKPGTPTSEMQQQMQKLLFGGETIQSRTVYLDKAYAVTVGGGEQGMKDLLDGIESSKLNSIAKIRETCMKEANLLFFMDLPRFMGDALGLVATRIEGFPLPINSQMIDSLNLKPSYIGMAAGSEKNTARFELNVPIDQIIGMSKLVITIGATARGGL